jgi:hypothetical protein
MRFYPSSNIGVAQGVHDRFLFGRIPPMKMFITFASLAIVTLALIKLIFWAFSLGEMTVAVWLVPMVLLYIGCYGTNIPFVSKKGKP